MTPRAVVSLGIGQCVNWGVLYYSFTVLLLPVERDLGARRWVVTGAFSLALLVSALLAPAVGRWGDSGRGPLVMQGGGFAASALLLFWALTPGVVTLYVVWAGLGACMAMTLYEPAFSLVARSHDTADGRLRALALVTVLGGLASTVFLPATAVMLGILGWRITVVALSAILLGCTLATRRAVFDRLQGTDPGPVLREPADDVMEPSDGVHRFRLLLSIFSFASFASAAFTANLVPALSGRAVSPATAAMLGGLLGVMQLPGRALLMTGVLAASPARLLVATLLLQSAGLLLVAVAESMLALAGGIMVFAAGAGLTTLVRPHLVQTVFGVTSVGYLNGRLARGQQLARAAGPVAVVWLSAAVGYGGALALLGGAFAVLALASYGVLRVRPGAAVKKGDSPPFGKP